MLEQKLEEYVSVFHENFPIFFYRHLKEEELVEMIDSAISTNTSEDDGTTDL